MRTLIKTVVLWVIALSVSSAAIPSEPDYTLLWNNISAVTVVDSFAVASSPDGVVVLKRDAVTGLFRETTHLFLHYNGVQHKKRGDILSVRTTADAILFFDLSNLPEITLMGTTDIGQPYLDYTFEGNDLYVCMGFDGLHRYQLTDYSSADFVDSSMTGIHYTSVDIFGDSLYAIDDYNGVLRYDISGSGFGIFQDYLFLPFQARSAHLHGDKLYVATWGDRILISDLSLPSFQVSDSIRLLIEADRVFYGDTLAAVFTNRLSIAQFVSLNTNSGFVAQYFDPARDSLAGDVYSRDGDVFVMLPTLSGGLAEFNATDYLNNPSSLQVLSRPGPIVNLEIQNGFLHTAGGANPPDRYVIEPGGRPVFDQTFFPGLTNISAFDMSHDTMYVLYQSLGRVFLWNVANPGDPLLGSSVTNATSGREIILHDSPTDSVRCFSVIGDRLLDMIGASDSGIVLPRLQVEMLDEVSTAAVFDTMMFVATRKSGISTYRLYSNFDYEFRGSVSLSFPANLLMKPAEQLWAFTGREVVVYDQAAPAYLMHVDTVISLPHRVEDAVIDGNMLYTVGPTGISVFDLSSGLPTLVDEGGMGGSMIAAWNGTVLISNGNSIHSYNLLNLKLDVNEQRAELPREYELYQNYPNPFNPVTTISWSMPSKSDVRLSVFNILGQEVRVLLDEVRTAGVYDVEWDGRDGNGQTVSSGVYFYRLVADEVEQSRKMILLK